MLGSQDEAAQAMAPRCLPQAQAQQRGHHRRLALLVAGAWLLPVLPLPSRGADGTPRDAPAETAAAAKAPPASPLPGPAASPAQAAAALRAEATTLFGQGTQTGREQGLLRLAAARKLLQSIGDTPGLAQLTMLQGFWLFALGRYREAVAADQEALRLYGVLRRPDDQAQLRLSLARNYQKLGDYGRARAELAQVLAAGRRSGNSQLSGWALELESDLDARDGQVEPARRKLEQAIALAAGRGDAKEQIRLLDHLILGQVILGQLDGARSALQRRKALAPGEVSLAETMLRTLESRSRPEDLESPAAIEAQIRMLRQAGDLTNTAARLEALATIQASRGQLRGALASYQEALELYEKQGMRGRAAETLCSIGTTLAALGEYGRSLEMTGRALELARAVGEEGTQTKALLYLADLQQAVGSFDLAIASNEAALALARKQGDRFRQVNALTALADLQRKLQHPNRAVELAGQAMELGGSSGMAVVATAALSTQVRALESQGQLEAALQAAQQIGTIGRSKGDPWISATAEALQGRVLVAMGRASEALPLLERSLAVFREQRQIPALIATLDVRARALAAAQRLGEAVEGYREEERLCAAMGDPRCQAAVLYEQSRLTARLGQPQQALTLIERSLAISEGLRSSLPSGELRQSYFAQVQDQYDWCIELLLQLNRLQPNQGHDLQALALSERARARGLVELLSAARAEADSGVDPALLARRRSLDSQIRAALAGRLRLRQDRAIEGDRAHALADLEGRLAELQRQQLQVEQQLRRSSPRYADLLLPRSLDAKAIQALVDADTVLLETHLGESQGVLWLIDRQGVETHRLPGRSQIQQLVFAALADIKDDNPGPSDAAKALSQLLLQPVAGRLAGKRLAIVPHGALVYLPFAALPDPSDGQPLLLSHELISLPSATTLAVLRRENTAHRSGPPAVLLLADPVFGREDPRLERRAGAATAAQLPGDRGGNDRGDGEWQRLPGTAREANAISALLPAGSVRQLELGFQANRQGLLSGDLRAFRWVHIATHGKADGIEPERSRLVLSLYDAAGRPLDGNLRLADIYNLRLNADLVVLSACQSGLGPLVRGEGLVGLTRGFQYAGARRVLASLWNVDDSSTATLMSIFYRGLVVDRLSPAAALRLAQRSLLANPATASPYHWAAFTLHGDWH